MSNIAGAARVALRIQATPSTIIELAEWSGFEPKTIRKWVRAMHDEGMVIPDGKRRGAQSRGMVSIIWKLNDRRPYGVCDTAAPATDARLAQLAA